MKEYRVGVVGATGMVGQRFVSLLEERGVTATVRRTLGSDIEASCGQLRRKAMEDRERTI